MSNEWANRPRRPEGNERTDMAPEFRHWDTVQKTRIELDTREKEHVIQETGSMAPDAGMIVTDTAQRMGVPMSARKFQKVLRRINPNFYFEVSNNFKEKTGIYLIIPGIGKQFICGMETGIAPEFSIMEAEIKGIPDPTQPDGMRWINSFAGEKRGWKSVLAVLLRGGYITVTHLKSYFKIDFGGRQSAHWHEFLNGGNGAVELLHSEIEESSNVGTEVAYN